MAGVEAGLLSVEFDRPAVPMGGEVVGMPGLPGIAAGASSVEEEVGPWGSSQPTVIMMMAKNVINRVWLRSKTEFLGLGSS